MEWDWLDEFGFCFCFLMMCFGARQFECEYLSISRVIFVHCIDIRMQLYSIQSTTLRGNISLLNSTSFNNFIAFPIISYFFFLPKIIIKLCVCEMYTIGMHFYVSIATAFCPMQYMQGTITYYTQRKSYHSSVSQFLNT